MMSAGTRVWEAAASGECGVVASVRWRSGAADCSVWRSSAKAVIEGVVDSLCVLATGPCGGLTGGTGRLLCPHLHLLPTDPLYQMTPECWPPDPPRTRRASGRKTARVCNSCCSD